MLSFFREICMIWQKQLDWLVTMSKENGWKAYAWQRAKDLDRDLPGISKELARIMNENKSAVSQSQTDAKSEERQALGLSLIHI